MKHKTTKQHFKWFCESVNYWIHFFGLLDWEVFIKHEHERDSRAWNYYKTEGKICEIGLNTGWNAIKPTRETLDEVVFHEVLEIGLATIVNLSCHTHSINQYEVHGFVRRMENCVYPLLPKWWEAKQ